MSVEGVPGPDFVDGRGPAAAQVEGYAFRRVNFLSILVLRTSFDFFGVE